jgi:hypothetical protein
VVEFGVEKIERLISSAAMGGDGAEEARRRADGGGHRLRTRGRRRGATPPLDFRRCKIASSLTCSIFHVYDVEMFLVRLWPRGRFDFIPMIGLELLE